MAAHRKLTDEILSRIASLRDGGMSYERIAETVRGETGVRVTRQGIALALARTEPPTAAPPSPAAVAAPPALVGSVLLSEAELDELVALVDADGRSRLRQLARRAADELLRSRRARANELSDETLVDQVLARFPGSPPPEAMMTAGAVRVLQRTLVDLSRSEGEESKIKGTTDQLLRSLETLLGMVPAPEVDPSRDPSKLVLRQAVRDTIMSYLVPVEAKYGRYGAANENR